jgi:hypothetical protein
VLVAGVTEELVTLDSVVDALRIELSAMARKLRDEATADTLAFEVLEVEIELQVVASTATKGTGTVKGGLELKVLGFGGGDVGGTLAVEHGWSRAATQKVKLKLKPKASRSKDPKRDEIEIADEG